LSISLRPLTEADEPFLWEMLYQALYVPKGAEPFPRDIVKHPEINRYVEGWGRSDDTGFAATDETEQQPIGAAWVRLLTGDQRGYGYVDDTTPELSIAIMPEYRGHGVGTRLLAHPLKSVQTRFRAISLSVSLDNPAVRLYERLGFEAVGASRSSLTMVKKMGVEYREGDYSRSE
jgi:ribosomal protein S18 acetylase RimI-like enzyme